MLSNATLDFFRHSPIQASPKSRHQCPHRTTLAGLGRKSLFFGGILMRCGLWPSIRVNRIFSLLVRMVWSCFGLFIAQGHLARYACRLHLNSFYCLHLCVNLVVIEMWNTISSCALERIWLLCKMKLYDWLITKPIETTSLLDPLTFVVANLVFNWAKIDYEPKDWNRTIYNSN